MPSWVGVAWEPIELHGVSDDAGGQLQRHRRLLRTRCGPTVPALPRGPFLPERDGGTAVCDGLLQSWWGSGVHYLPRRIVVPEPRFGSRGVRGRRVLCVAQHDGVRLMRGGLLLFYASQPAGVSSGDVLAGGTSCVLDVPCRVCVRIGGWRHSHTLRCGDVLVGQPTGMHELPTGVRLLELVVVGVGVPIRNLLSRRPGNVSDLPRRLQVSRGQLSARRLL